MSENLTTIFSLSAKEHNILTEVETKDKRKAPQDDHNMALCVYQLMGFGGMEILGCECYCASGTPKLVSSTLVVYSQIASLNKLVTPMTTYFKKKRTGNSHFSSRRTAIDVFRYEKGRHLNSSVQAAGTDEAGTRPPLRPGRQHCSCQGTAIKITYSK